MIWQAGVPVGELYDKFIFTFTSCLIFCGNKILQANFVLHEMCAFFCLLQQLDLYIKEIDISCVLYFLDLSKYILAAAVAEETAAMCFTQMFFYKRDIVAWTNFFGMSSQCFVTQILFPCRNWKLYTTASFTSSFNFLAGSYQHRFQDGSLS